MEMSPIDFLKEQTAKVVADNLLKKSLRTYAKKGKRDLLAVTEFDGILEEWLLYLPSWWQLFPM